MGNFFKMLKMRFGRVDDLRMHIIIFSLIFSQWKTKTTLLQRKNIFKLYNQKAEGSSTKFSCEKNSPSILHAGSGVDPAVRRGQYILSFYLTLFISPLLRSHTKTYVCDGNREQTVYKCKNCKNSNTCWKDLGELLTLFTSQDLVQSQIESLSCTNHPLFPLGS